jgi:hypothetical protein
MEAVFRMHTGALIDAHVHFYPCFEVEIFLDMAVANFSKANRGDALWVLCLAESRRDYWFDSLVADPKKILPRRWSLRATAEDVSLILARDDGVQLALIAGHQIVSAENIEVLTIGQRYKMADGAPATQVIGNALEHPSLPLLPWGFGKWLGARGALVEQLMQTFGTQLLLGDNGGRLAQTATPSLLKRAAAAGHRLLAGSDPLPFPREARRVASYGAYLEGQMRGESPFAELQMLLATQAVALPYGEAESPGRFLRNQGMMQWRKRVASV